MPSIDGLMIEQDPAKSLREGHVAPNVDVMIGDVSNEYTMFVNLSMTADDYNTLVVGPSAAPYVGPENAAVILPRYPASAYDSPGSLFLFCLFFFFFFFSSSSSQHSHTYIIDSLVST